MDTDDLTRPGCRDPEGALMEECGCCEINDFEPTDDPDNEPWCFNCNHSPEEHE
jgi:hypothetical protein